MADNCLILQYKLDNGAFNYRAAETRYTSQAKTKPGIIKRVRQEVTKNFKDSNEHDVLFKAHGLLKDKMWVYVWWPYGQTDKFWIFPKRDNPKDFCDELKESQDFAKEIVIIIGADKGYDFSQEEYGHIPKDK